MAAVEDNKQTAQDEHTGTDEHGEDEFLSRKALQRYMHTTKVMQEQGKTQQDDRTEDESNKTKSKGGDPAAVSGPAASGNGAEKVGNKGDNHDEQDFEHILRLDSAGDAEGDEKLLSKLVDEAKSKDDEGEEVERNVVEVLEDDEDEDDDMVTATRNGLLESLNTDVEKYHKKVQLKKKFDNSALVMEKRSPTTSAGPSNSQKGTRAEREVETARMLISNVPAGKIMKTTTSPAKVKEVHTRRTSLWLPGGRCLRGQKLRMTPLCTTRRK